MLIENREYRLELIWEKLSEKDLTTLEKVKAKILLGLLMNSALQLACKTFLIEDLRMPDNYSD